MDFSSFSVLVKGQLEMWVALVLYCIIYIHICMCIDGEWMYLNFVYCDVW